MEILIPPRNNGSTTYKYEWDENGEVLKTERVGDLRSPKSPITASSARLKRGRQTVQWPFQSITDASLSLSRSRSKFSYPNFRRATWQSRPQTDNDSIIDRSLIPDYVINYLRGETPETIARRKANNGQKAPHGVDIEAGARLESNAAEIYGDLSSPTGTGDQMLRGPGEGKSGKNGGIRRFAHGWRGGVALNALLSLIILAAAVGCLIVTVSRSRMLFSGETAISSGSAAATMRLNLGLRVLVSVLGLVLLMGANYVFQVLSSPTRPELRAAHDKGRWLDIGIPSVRNFAHIANGRVFLSVIVIVVTVLTQVIYNSLIFTSAVGVESNLVLVTRGFLTGTPFSNTSSNNAAGLSRIEILSLLDLANRDELTDLTTAECFDEFRAPFSTTYRGAIIISSVATVGTGNSIVQTGTTLASLNLNTPTGFSSCLAQAVTTAPTHTLFLNASLLGVLALLNLIAFASTAATLLLFRRMHPYNTASSPLVTLGDALASFLRDPDLTTRGACLLAKEDVRQCRWSLREEKYYLPRPRSIWLFVPSLSRWALFFTPWVSLAGLAAAALAVAISKAPGHRLSGFGASTTSDVLSGVGPLIIPLPSSTPPTAAALLAALPQLLLAALYLATNSLLTTYFLSREAEAYAAPAPTSKTASSDPPLTTQQTHNAHPLRVSADPRGAQTTSLFLTLPRPWSWALLALFSALGFVLGQSLVVVDAAFTAPSSPRLVALGVSGAGMLALVALLLALMALVLGLGCSRGLQAVRPPTAEGTVTTSGAWWGRGIGRRRGGEKSGAEEGEGGNPLTMVGGSCSAVISAWCHRLKGEADVYLGRVAFGVVYESEGGVGHCSFSARGVRALKKGGVYK